MKSIKLIVYHANDDDPKKCSAKKMNRMGFAHLVTSPKKYRSYYSAFNINISCPVNEISEIFTIASLQKADFAELENEIVKFIGDEGKFSNSVAEEFNMTLLALKSIVKRSEKLGFKGLKIIKN